ncbi:SMI1/KNR4 family protein [Streptacidiphilus sp. MAP5-3]|jgi:cell wall assembly regulator SMI1|uniref:SMI1/KNR4 family protein n=1 Tax=unclassified Streptacidiphilus TaxID=2643834 RepID=UPI00351287FC
MAGVEREWERIEAFVLRRGLGPLPGGAEEEAITALEERLGTTFPVDLRDSYLRHDGGPVPIATHGGRLAVVELLPLSAIGAEYAFLVEESFGALAGWIPVEAQPDGSHLAVGKDGQVAVAEAGCEPDDVDHPSWAAWLSWVADGLDAPTG